MPAAAQTLIRLQIDTLTWLEPSSGGPPYLVPATSIGWRVEMRKAGRTAMQASHTRPPATDKNELVRMRTFGHRVGVMLRLEGSFRTLLTRDDDPERDFWARRVFDQFTWSAENDDMFASAFETLRKPNRPTQDDQYLMQPVRMFLKRNLLAIESSTLSEMRAPAMALSCFEERGAPDDLPLLRELIVHPVLGEQAASLMEQIETRAALTAK